MLECKQVFIDGEPTQYFLFNNGDLYNGNSHLISKGSLSNGYIRYNFSFNGKQTSIAKHRLLAQMFLENDDPEHKTVVHHKDGCPQNNNLDNLEWISQKENCQKRINPIEHKITESLTEEELANEIWLPFKDTNYEVSNMGRIKNLKTGYITFGSRNKNSGYIRWVFRNENGGQFEMQAHRAIYMTFHPDEEIQVINHIDSNRGNNRLDNLENISQSENVIKSYYQTSTKKTVIVAQCDNQGNILNVYPSISEACRTLNIKYTSGISKAIKEGTRCQGFKWKEISIEEYNNFKQKDCEVAGKPIELRELSEE